MDLTEVLAFLGLEPNVSSCALRDIKIDSRCVQPGDLFCAVAGLTANGQDYIEQAKANGAAAVLDQPDLASKLPDLAAFFYGYPAQDLKIIGITGTNGKTSCSHYTAQILNANNLTCGVMGTLGNGLLGSLTISNLTTSDCCTVQKQFAEFRTNKVPYVAMEASSHALDQGRLRGIKFDTVVFTNLSQDHLDYHANLTDYFAAKARLFTEYQARNCVINLDDPYAMQLLNLIAPESNIVTYSLNNSQADIYLAGSILHTPWGSAALHTPLLGKFNLSNVLACIACCGLQGLNLAAILAAVNNLTPVPGRMQQVPSTNPDMPLVVIDYAHTPDAITKALQALREYTDKNIYCIFGCGGDRDRSKRPLMLRAAIEYSDKVIITQDNPRTEDPQQIVNDMLEDVIFSDATITIELDRELAIQQTIIQATAQDVILIAGKGHEDYQIIGTKKLPFSDLLVAQQALNLRSMNSWAV